LLPIQVILVAVLVAIGGVYLTALASRLVARITTILVVALGIGFVLNPDLTTRIARAVGVGRGADLLLYLLCVAVFGTFLRFFRRERELERKLTELARSVAIMEAERVETQP
jgi:hypothetical protein